MSAADAMHVKAIYLFDAPRPLPAGTEKYDAMAAAGQAAEDLMQVNLSAARLRISYVLPVDDEQMKRLSSGHRASGRFSGSRE